MKDLIRIGSEVFIIVKQSFHMSKDGFLYFSEGGTEDWGVYPAKVLGIQRTNRLSLLVQTGRPIDEYMYMIQSAEMGGPMGVSRKDLYLTEEEALASLEGIEKGE